MWITAAVAAATAVAWLVVRQAARSLTEKPSIRGQDPPTYDVDPHVVALLRTRADRARKRNNRLECSAT